MIYIQATHDGTAPCCERVIDTRALSLTVKNDQVKPSALPGWFCPCGGSFFPMKDQMAQAATLSALPFPPGSRVLYVPPHAAGDPMHQDCEAGIVSSARPGRVFVRFDKQVQRHGWDGATSQACDPGDLVLLPEFPFDQPSTWSGDAVVDQ